MGLPVRLVGSELGLLDTRFINFFSFLGTQMGVPFGHPFQNFHTYTHPSKKSTPCKFWKGLVQGSGLQLCYTETERTFTYFVAVANVIEANIFSLP